MKIETYVLKDGTEVRITQVPIVLSLDALHKVLGDGPEEPVKDVPTVAGKERVKVEEGDPLYDEYLEAKKTYAESQESFLRSFAWDAGVIDWKPPKAKKSMTQPPKDWVMPPTVAKLGLVDEHVDVRRVAYIRYDLVSNPEDNLRVQNFIYNGALLSDEEVSETVNTFPDQE